MTADSPLSSSWPSSPRPGNSAAAIGFSAADEVLSFFADVGRAP